eukprot:COSAG02_NODE_26676_length_627_cov_1.433712_1_plen_34_part_10
MDCSYNEMCVRERKMPIPTVHIMRYVLTHDHVQC